MDTGSPSGLSHRQQDRIQHAIDTCRDESGLTVSVLVGDLGCDARDASAFRTAAERLHAALGPAAAATVLLVVAPGQRRVELVTGPMARRRVPDRVASLAVLSMASAFAGGDLAGGIVDGLRQLSQSAGRTERPAPAGHSSDLARSHA